MSRPCTECPHLPPPPAPQIPFPSKRRPLHGRPPSSCTLGSRPRSTINPDQPAAVSSSPSQGLPRPPLPAALPSRPAGPLGPLRALPAPPAPLRSPRPGRAALTVPSRRRSGRPLGSTRRGRFPITVRRGAGARLGHGSGGRRRRGLLRLQPRRRSGNRYARGPRRETGAAGPGLRLLRLILTAAAGGGRRRRRSAAQAPTVRARERLPPAGPGGPRCVGRDVSCAGRLRRSQDGCYSEAAWRLEGPPAHQEPHAGGGGCRSFHLSR